MIIIVELIARIIEKKKRKEWTKMLRESPNAQKRFVFV